MQTASMDLNRLLQHASESGVSDIHLKAGRPPVFRKDGALAPGDEWPALSETDLESVLVRVCGATPRRAEAFAQTGELDTAYTSSGLPRFRVNGFRQRGAISFAFRLIPREVAGFDALGLPIGVRAL